MHRNISRQIENRKSNSIAKKQDEKAFWNYRPISLSSSVSKVFESIVFDQLHDYFTTNGLLFNSQYGFRKHHSTELAALELTEKIRREIDQKKTPFSIYLDLSKAFDTLNHAMLLQKTPILWLVRHHFILFQKLSFWPYSVRWIRRSSFVKETYRHMCATRFNIVSFIIFYIYMNDIQTVSERLNFVLYADDTTLTSTLCTFTQEVTHDVNHMSYSIN